MEGKKRLLRQKTSLPIKFSGGSILTSVYEGTIVDLSLGGARIFISEPLPKLDDIVFNLTLPHNVHLDKIHAVVAYYQQEQNRYYMGVKFTNLKLDKLRLLTEYLWELQREREK